MCLDKFSAGQRLLGLLLCSGGGILINALLSPGYMQRETFYFLNSDLSNEPMAAAG